MPLSSRGAKRRSRSSFVRVAEARWIGDVLSTSPNVDDINAALQTKLRQHRSDEVTAVEAARWLDAAGLLKDSDARPGLPLRNLLRAHRINGAVQRPAGPADAGTSLGALEAVAGEMPRRETGDACRRPRRLRDLPLAIS
jgi:hypothetical protein